jgi:hypothetical protein
MAKIKTKADVKSILERMLKVSGMEDMEQLANKLGLSTQGLQSAKHRESIYLGLLMFAVDEWHTTLDYLVYGSGPMTRTADTSDDKLNMNIVITGENSTVNIPAKLFRQGTEEANLRAVIKDGIMFIVDTKNQSVTDGLFAFGDLERPVVRRCILQMDGSIHIEGIPEPQFFDSMPQYKIAGRVVWQGESK